ncbi:PREDICTED: dyslexia-associated protein KIAA0319-like protein [Priapulus caudatus]|uniref:Dyslexia-associated protein KIAA0319-like protein n=1 Tax=Priapulus caudatus TaxID=37621 RepID=A0ABM1EFM0_PRICU|nr:PREDICTED: dyslexia-associated protein KIAA0319-like protein [Priapulus caudatus]
MKDDQATLHLKSLAPGFYQFKLTVTDSDDATNSTIANVTVIKETDYPPTANAGPDKIVKLPSGEITLWGNASTDDHGIASYEWSKTSTTGAVDMQGSHKAFLHLTNLELGDYTFRLKVTDTLGQSSEADVHVFVQPEAQGGPRADAGVDKEISAPNDTVMLDGSNSEGVTTYEWTQLKGPAGAVIVSPAEAQTKVTKLAIAEYEFQLTVKDSQEKSDSASVHVKVKQVENRPPTADAGRPQAMRLPDNLLLLNGSKSSDDLGIISYEWTKQDTSPAAGEFLGRTQLEKIAMVTGFVPGHYVFQLKVTDGQGASATAVTTVEVHPSSHQVELVQMEIDADPMTYTVAQKNELISQLQLLLRTQQDDVIVNIDGLERQQNSGRMIVLFYVTRPVAAAVADGKNKHQPEREMLPGPEVAAQLLKRLKADASVLGTPVYSVDTLVCQNNCSHHGHCEQVTKLCKCDPFWLQNFFKAYLFNEESNCDWSILYFIIVVFILIVTSSCVVWACIWCVRRLRGKKYTKKQHHKYKLLSDEEFSAPDMRKVPKTKLVPRKQQPALFTDSDSDEETLYENAKNGIRIHNVNGFSRRQKKI